MAYREHRFIVLLLGGLTACGGDAATGTGGGGAGSDPGSTSSASGTGGGGASGTGGVAAGGGTAGSGGGTAGGGGDGGACGGDASYDARVLCDHPVAFWAVNPTSGSEPDLTGNHNSGTYHRGTPELASLPNGDHAADFDGATQYLSIPSNASLSIPTTGSLTWEGWIRPDVLQFPHASGGYVDWMGKCDSYAPTCEWEARMYNTTNPQDRCNRLSAYAFNPGADLGSGADWQPVCGLFQPGQWLHVVGEYTTLDQPPDCPTDPDHPGSLDIWVDGVRWDQAAHNPTGCMSQYQVVPEANGSALNIGTMARDTWFQGAVGKVAVYGYLLTQAQISAHYEAMTGHAPTGSCSDSCSL